MGLPHLRTVLFCIPLPIGNITLALLAVIVYFVTCISLLNQYINYPLIPMDKFIYGSLMALMVLHTIACSTFIAGIVKQRTELLYPWLWSHALLTLDIMWGAILLTASPFDVFMLVTYVGIQIYIWLCGYSMYNHIDTQEWFQILLK